MARTRRREGRSPLAVGVIALVVIAILTFLGFTKDIPFTTPYQVKAVFQSSNGLRPDSPVRIAGVEVGKVKQVDAQDGTDNAVVTMAIDKSGLPLHEDATAKIRPRIFLEGNFFVDLQPGTPGSPELDDGDTITVTQTATPTHPRAARPRRSRSTTPTTTSARPSARSRRSTRRFSAWSPRRTSRA